MASNVDQKNPTEVQGEVWFGVLITIAPQEVHMWDSGSEGNIKQSKARTLKQAKELAPISLQGADFHLFYYEMDYITKKCWQDTNSLGSSWYKNQRQTNRWFESEPRSVPRVCRADLCLSAPSARLTPCTFQTCLAVRSRGPSITIPRQTALAHTSSSSVWPLSIRDGRRTCFSRGQGGRRRIC